jgi:hypothetical protein
MSEGTNGSPANRGVLAGAQVIVRAEWSSTGGFVTHLKPIRLSQPKGNLTQHDGIAPVAAVFLCETAPHVAWIQVGHPCDIDWACRILKLGLDNVTSPSALLRDPRRAGGAQNGTVPPCEH